MPPLPLSLAPVLWVGQQGDTLVAVMGWFASSQPWSPVSVACEGIVS